MPLGKEVGLGPGHTALDGDPVGTQRPTAAPPHFSAHVYCGQTVAHLSNCWALVKMAEPSNKYLTVDCSMGTLAFSHQTRQRHPHSGCPSSGVGWTACGN